jgi:hypothetical protein
MSPVDTETPADALPAHASDDLWTADSERQPDALQTSDPVPANEPLEATPELPLETAPTADRDESGKFKLRSGKPRNDPQARVQQATAKEAAAKEDARLAREEAASLKTRLEALERAQRPAERAEPASQPSSRGQSATNEFPEFEDWVAAHPEIPANPRAWTIYNDQRTRWNWGVYQAELQQQQVIQNYQQQIETAKQSDPVLVQALANDPPVSPLMERAILASPNSIDIVRYLGTHPEDCAQLARETSSLSLDAVPVMRRHLETLVASGAVANRPDAAQSVKPSTANPPIHRVGGTASATPVDPDEMDFSPEYIRIENAKEKKRREQSRW